MCPGKGGQVKEMEEKGEKDQKCTFFPNFPTLPPLEEENAISLFFIDFFYLKKSKIRGRHGCLNFKE